MVWIRWLGIIGYCAYSNRNPPPLKKKERGKTRKVKRIEGSYKRLYPRFTTMNVKENMAEYMRIGGKIINSIRRAEHNICRYLKSSPRSVQPPDALKIMNSCSGKIILQPKAKDLPMEKLFPRRRQNRINPKWQWHKSIYASKCIWNDPNKGEIKPTTWRIIKTLDKKNVMRVK